MYNTVENEAVIGFHMERKLERRNAQKKEYIKKPQNATEMATI
jgi:hypothetical protein